jgi:hypothetical protein
MGRGELAHGATTGQAARTTAGNEVIMDTERTQATVNPAVAQVEAVAVEVERRVLGGP